MRARSGWSPGHGWHQLRVWRIHRCGRHNRSAASRARVRRFFFAAFARAVPGHVAMSTRMPSSAAGYPAYNTSIEAHSSAARRGMPLRGDAASSARRRGASVATCHRRRIAAQFITGSLDARIVSDSIAAPIRHKQRNPGTECSDSMPPEESASTGLKRFGPSRPIGQERSSSRGAPKRHSLRFSGLALACSRGLGAAGVRGEAVIAWERDPLT